MGHSGSSMIVEAVVLVEAVYCQLTVCASFEPTLRQRDMDSTVSELKHGALEVQFMPNCFRRERDLPEQGWHDASFKMRIFIFYTFTVTMQVLSQPYMSSLSGSEMRLFSFVLR